MRGQAAFELLASYGTMIMILLGSIAVLMYLGVIPMDSFSPNTCLIEPEFHCMEYKVSSDGNIYLSIRNNFGALKSVGINFTTQDCTIVNHSYTESNIAYNSFLNQENNDIVTFSCSEMLEEDETFTGLMTLQYIRTGQSISHIRNGKIVQRVE